jgi:hypothetical protein
MISISGTTRLDNWVSGYVEDALEGQIIMMTRRNKR